ncbi:MAG: C69 family dipeptidase [Myxococcales bacterium]|nr:C69 family dipeptidase [Myxococcales bacterium]
MCDTFVLLEQAGPVWLGKNSDRHPQELQRVESLPAGRARADDEAGERRVHGVAIARPRWMWGCEMGVNAAGLAVANVAVFTRLPVVVGGMTGMAMQRLALERCASAADALEQIIELLARYPQGGRTCLSPGAPPYHSSFLLADPREVWLLETAGHLWAARRVQKFLSISNGLTIEQDFERVHDDAFRLARARGYCRSSQDFGFARAFGRRLLERAAGCAVRRRLTERLLARTSDQGPVRAADIAAILRDHGGGRPGDGWRMQMPCAHASWLPTRTTGQTTASLIARLDARPRAWMTGTSAPCLSVFKPTPIGDAAFADDVDADGLWVEHEGLHRAVLQDYAPRRARFDASREALERRALTEDEDDVEEDVDRARARALWREHRAQLADWRARAEAAGSGGRRPFQRYWGRLARADAARW